MVYEGGDVTVRGCEYCQEDIEAFVYDSVVDGICSECESVTSVEPDACKYNCEACGAKGTVDSVLVILGLA